MRALEQLLGKDVVLLIYRKLHAMCNSEVVAEYHEHLVKFQGHNGHLENLYGYIFVKWKSHFRMKAYNHRFLFDASHGSVRNKCGNFVAPLPKNYWTNN